jgi:hypothetical protein
LDLGVIDDYVKDRNEANSKPSREKTWSWFTDVFMPRFSATSGLLILCTRWHVDDLLGRYLQRNTDVRVLRYPAIITGKKEVRAEPFVAQCQGDNVRLVAGDWVSAFLDECEAWPASTHKDQVDACAGAFNHLTAGYGYDTTYRAFQPGYKDIFDSAQSAQSVLMVIGTPLSSARRLQKLKARTKQLKARLAMLKKLPLAVAAVLVLAAASTTGTHAGEYVCVGAFETQRADSKYPRTISLGRCDLGGLPEAELKRS